MRMPTYYAYGRDVVGLDVGCKTRFPCWLLVGPLMASEPVQIMRILLALGTLYGSCTRSHPGRTAWAGQGTNILVIRPTWLSRKPLFSHTHQGMSSADLGYACECDGGNTTLEDSTSQTQAVECWMWTLYLRC